MENIEERDKRLVDKLLSILDDDIREIFVGYEYNSFALSIPLQMQLARSLRQLTLLIQNKTKGGDKRPDNGG